MTIDLERYNELKRKVERAKRDANRAEGKLDQKLAELREEFECETIKEAEKLLAKLEKESKAKEREATKALEAFEDKWATTLDEEQT